MTKKARKRGLPKKVEEVEEIQEATGGQSPEEFVEELFGEADQPQHGMPPLSWLKSQFKTKSAAIRYLVNQGFPIKLIAKHLGLRYQHARNVATSELKRGPNEDWRKPLLNKEDTPPGDDH